MHTKHLWTVLCLLSATPTIAQVTGKPVGPADHKAPNRVSGTETGTTIAEAQPNFTLEPAAEEPTPTANAFTPDGDGLNDKYFPRLPGAPSAEHLFQVYDRWGQVLFTTTNPNEGWDGRPTGGGDVLPQGVYAWRLETRAPGASEKQQILGSVTLVK